MILLLQLWLLSYKFTFCHSYCLVRQIFDFSCHNFDFVSHNYDFLQHNYYLIMIFPTLSGILMFRVFISESLAFESTLWCFQNILSQWREFGGGAIYLTDRCWVVLKWHTSALKELNTISCLNIVEQKWSSLTVSSWPAPRRGRWWRRVGCQRWRRRSSPCDPSVSRVPRHQASGSQHLEQMAHITVTVIMIKTQHVQIFSTFSILTKHC